MLNRTGTVEIVWLAFCSLSVDYLEQAFRSLTRDLRTGEGKSLFLRYQCVPILLRHLNASNKQQRSGALDALHQMATESGKLGEICILSEDVKFRWKQVRQTEVPNTKQRDSSLQTA